MRNGHADYFTRNRRDHFEGHIGQWIDDLAKRVAGFDHVGIGADYYGAETDNMLIQGLEDVSKYPELFAELVRRGWSDENLRKLAGENLLRVFGQVEEVAAQHQATRAPSLVRFEGE